MSTYENDQHSLMELFLRTLVAMRQLVVCGAYVLFPLLLLKISEGATLGKYIDHYEPLSYDHHALHAQHHRLKRSPSLTLTLDFQAFGRSFKLRLKRDTSVYSPDLVIQTSQGPVTYDMTRAYSGRLEGRGSYVHGVVTTEGHFEGKVMTPEEVYVIEHTRHHFDQPQDFHSVIYRASDVNFDLDSTLCKSDKLHEKIKLRQPSSSSGFIDDFYHHDTANVTNKYIERNHVIHKRSINSSLTTCELYIESDHMFYERHLQDTDKVIEQITQHVQAVNPIYSAIDFDGDSSPDNIRFIIKRIKVHTDPNSIDYKYPGNYGVETFLDMHSEQNYDDFCLAYMFTNRDFDNGVLGLAWTGDTFLSGGVCEVFKPYQSGSKSLNTGLVTTINYGNIIPSVVSHITLAHEIGHNLGSPHDPEGDTTCTPGSSPGNYIMYARATSGDKSNNNKFSSCSISSIAGVIEAKARHNNGCFKVAMTSICGNKVVEDSEECDCGWEDECTENCCNPQVLNAVLSTPTPCTLKSANVNYCSPSQGPCCSPSCIKYQLGDEMQCRLNSSCKDAAECDGTGASCPDSNSKPDATQCDDLRVCYLGECSASICLAHGMDGCQCAPDISGDWKDKKLCHVCCVDSSDNNICKSSFDLASVADLLTLPGSACMDYKGYCDVFYKCREVDPSGPLNNIRKLIMNGEVLQSMMEYLTTHWYIGLAAALGLVIMTVLVVRLCSYSHVPQKQKTYRRNNQLNNPRNRISPKDSGWI